jgi:ABC-type uncharacterized transport system permease subunit
MSREVNIVLFYRILHQFLSRIAMLRSKQSLVQVIHLGSFDVSLLRPWMARFLAGEICHLDLLQSRFNQKKREREFPLSSER